MQEIELFKAKMPSNAWNACDVMLNDVAQSAKLVLVNSSNISSTIRSHLYWPQKENLKIPGLILNDDLEHIEEEFTRLYPTRYIRWDATLSRVKLAIDFNMKVHVFECDQLQASILLHVQDSPDTGCSIHNVTEKFGAEKIVIDSIAHWLRRRVLCLEEERLSLATNYRPDAQGTEN